MTGHLTHPPDLSMVPESERPVLLRALAKEPGKRWPNCRAFVEALAAVGAPPTPTPTPAPIPTPPVPDVRRWPVVAVIATVLLAAGLGIWSLGGRKSDVESGGTPGTELGRPSVVAGAGSGDPRTARAAATQPETRRTPTTERKPGQLKLALPEQIVVKRGTREPVAIQVRRTDYDGPVALTVHGPARGFTFNPPPILAGGDSTAALLVADGDAPLGEHSFRIVADGGTLKDEATLKVRVEEVPKPQPPSLAKAPFDAAEAKKLQQAWAAYLGRKVEEVVDLGEGVAMEFVLIPPGTYTMGSPTEEGDRYKGEVPHQVTLPRPFYLAKYPVTQQQYERVMNKNPSTFSPSGSSKDQVQGLDTSRFPVENVSWEEAVAYCQKLPQRTGWKAGLPTEAQWEYACRAGTTTPFWFGKELNGTQANCDGTVPYGTSVKGPYLKRTCRGGENKDPLYPQNSFGLFDMHGNVWQWCNDWYGDYDVDKSIDPQGPDKGDARVVRGGSWFRSAWWCRAAYRGGFGPGDRFDYVGFRVAFRLD